MTTTVVCIVCVAMVVVGCMTLSQGILTSADAAALSAQQLSVREGEMMRTRLTGIGSALSAGNALQAIIKNSGQTRLSSYDKWDFIVQYYDAADNYYVNWLPYHSGELSDNQWKDAGIYYNSQPEAFEPGILNPQEQINLEALLNPAAGYRAITITISTSNGVAPTLVCGPPTLTTHAENVSPGGTTYYMLKGWTSADGPAVTATTDSISGNVTGRWLLHDSEDAGQSASHLFPLSGINRISAATWTLNYRGRADGWASGTETNACLSIDVIIRKADGTIREVLDTDAGQGYFTTSNNWTDIPASYNFPGYVVTDDTDYLEIDYYGNSENSGPVGTSYIRLMIDDNSLSEASQTRIAGLVWA